jgi:hypothetical protein
MSNNKYRICIGREPGNVHWQAFVDLATDMVWALRKLGCDCDALGWAGFNPQPGKTNIVLGWHLLDERALTNLPERTILYNLEQLRNRQDALLLQLAVLSHLVEVWDYSQANIHALEECGASSVKRVAVGSMAGVSSEKKIPGSASGEVLFYGSVNDRRFVMIQEVAKRVGVHLLPVGTYGVERQHCIDDARVVLNLHYYVPASFEIVRCAHLFARHKAVVAERGPDTELDADLEGAAEFVPYEQLPEACERLVRNHEARRQLEARAYEIISKQRNEVDILRVALEVPCTATASVT